ncbi:BNR/Asp-box repeat protein [compost metagenome]
MKKSILALSILMSAFNGISQINWTQSMTGFDPTYMPADFVTASNGDVYVNGVKYDNGISSMINKLYKSTNQGASWAEISTTGLTTLGNVQSLTISGNKIILAGMDVVPANGSKIFTSSDNGASWALSMTGFDPTYMPVDFVTASNGDIYVTGDKYDNGTSSFLNKLYKSTNQGTSWTEVSTTGLTSLGNVQTLAISGNKIILGGVDVVPANGCKIFASSDNGNSWTQSMTGFDPTYMPVDFVTASNGDIYVTGDKYDNGTSSFLNKLYKSTNQGTSWTEVSTTGLTSLGNVQTLAISGNKIILGGVDVVPANGCKIFASSDNGNSWTQSMTGFDPTYMPVDFVTASNGDIYVTGDKYDNGTSSFLNKLYKSTDQGASWTEVSTTGLTTLGNVQTLTISGSKMILGGMDVVSANGSKIFTSDFSVSTAGIHETEPEKMVTIFPNPSTDIVNLDFTNNQPKSIKLTTLTGELIKQISTTSLSSVQFEVNDLSSGLYLIVVENNSETQKFKLLKN